MRKKLPRNRHTAATVTKHRLEGAVEYADRSVSFRCTCGRATIAATWHLGYEAFGKHLKDAVDAARIVEGAMVIVRRADHPLHSAVGTVKIASQHSSFVDFDGGDLRLLRHIDIERIRIERIR